MYKKIDLFYRGKYMHSTNSYKTCKEAIQSGLKTHKCMNEKDLKAYFSKN